MKNKHALFVTSGLKPTAPNQITSAVIRAFQTKFIIQWFAFDNLVGKEFYGIQDTQINGSKKKFSLFTFLNYLIQIKPAVAHISLARAAFFAIPLIKIFSPETKIIYVNHGLHELRERFSWLRFAITKVFVSTLTLSDKIVNVSEYAKVVLLAYSDVSHKSITIHNGVNLRKYYPHPKALRDKIFSSFFPDSDPQKSFLIGNAANLISLKGHSDVINALPYVLNAGHDVKYIVWGDGPERQALKSLSEKLKVSAHVAFVGHVHELEKLYPCLDLYIQSSYDESFGMSVIEAMACQVPVIVTEVGGLKEIVCSSEVGWTYVPGNNLTLAAKITDAITNKIARINKAKTGRLRVLQNFSEQLMATQYLSLISDVLENK